MNKREMAKRLWAAVFHLAPLALLANGVRLGSQDGFASARGEAFAATADNPSAIFYNPAGITQLAGHQVRGGVYGLYYNPTFRPPDDSRTHHVNERFAAAPQLFYTGTPRTGPLSFGLGIYAPFGGKLNWPQDTGFRAVTLKSALQYATINPVLALKVSPTFSVGAGVMLNYANLELTQGIRRDQLPPPFTDVFRFKGDGWSVGYNAGVLWQPHETLAFGASFRSAAAVALNGHTEVLLFPVIPTPYRSAADTRYNFPLTAVVGVSYRPTPDWNLEFNADYTDWSSFGTITIHQAAPNNNVQPNPSFILDWQPSWMYAFGATRYLPNGWHVSAGYLFNENSVPDAHYTPAVADLDRHFFSLGAGRRGARLDWDVVYQFGYGPARRVTGSTPSTVGQIAGQTADGTYEFISHAVLLTVGFRF
jgi:long-chain fatty acid transport protein